MTPTFQFEPFPKSLYKAETLFSGFDPTRPESYVDMLDFRIFREFQAAGGAATGDYLIAMSRALHDNGITQHLADAVAGKHIVGIMGGHSAARGDADYVAAAQLSAALTREGYLVASGGGPGVMEAVHLGAGCVDEKQLHDVLAQISAKDVTPSIPANATSVVSPDGTTVDRAIAEALGKYLAPAVTIRKQLRKGGGLGIPTWMYGFEPFTPFADLIAKYFQNSIREDGLLALATHGVIYMRGSAGTMQEVFQDAAQNYYHSFPIGQGQFSPMVFFGKFWTDDIPVGPVMDALFHKPSPADPKAPIPKSWAEYSKWVKFLNSVDQTLAHIKSFPGQPESRMLARVRHSRSGLVRT
ncbi:hypothetical protein IVA86_00155 [Bradyrhizobium sp. 146]|uniref:LOG family protein n=1 Tax=Bradyrhizobium sp. 146 TaxID=2782622 RepID=UPI001FFA8A8A|nr:hypothetical protein [Bradyrhizobium sp. 146]MCK1699896.1 hypothetical protein [Bradyrhizobium sp. 146]